MRPGGCAGGGGGSKSGRKGRDVWGPALGSGDTQEPRACVCRGLGWNDNPHVSLWPLLYHPYTLPAPPESPLHPCTPTTRLGSPQGVTPRLRCGALSFLSFPLRVRPPRCGHTPGLALGVSSGSPCLPCWSGPSPLCPAPSTSSQSRSLLASPSDVRLSLGCARGGAGDGRAAGREVVSGGCRCTASPRLRPTVLERGERSANVLQLASQWRFLALWATRCLSSLLLPALVWPTGVICENRRLAQFGARPLANLALKNQPQSGSRAHQALHGSSCTNVFLNQRGCACSLSPPRPSDSVVLTFLQPS